MEVRPSLVLKADVGHVIVVASMIERNIHLVRGYG